jgi:histidinol-phosphate aminotransferase
VLAAIKAATDDGLRLYSDPNGDSLKQALADYYGLKRSQVFVGNGSDEVLAHTFQALLKQDRPLLFPDITYSFYPVYCGLFEIEYECIPLRDDFSIAPQDYQRPNGGIIFANPNAPTGIALSLASVEKVVAANPDSVVVVDEAYVDFGAESAVSLIDRYPNVLVIQTLSKSRSLAGLRVGFAFGSEELIDGLERVKNSFNSYPLDTLALAGAVAAIEDKAYFEKTCGRVIANRDAMQEGLEALGFEVLPSATNFLFVRHEALDAAELAAKLREQSIIVRYFNKPRISEYLRISVGNEQEVAALLAAIKQIKS